MSENEQENQQQEVVEKQEDQPAENFADTMANHKKDSDLDNRQSAEATLKKNESYTASRNKFFQSASVENGKMLMTGMSAFSNSNHMMLAKNNLKMMTH